MKTRLTRDFTEALLEPGETISLCRCGDSDKWPLCDGSHKHIAGRVAQCTPAIVSAVPQPTVEVSGLPIQIVVGVCAECAISLDQPHASWCSQRVLETEP